MKLLIVLFLAQTANATEPMETCAPVVAKACGKTVLPRDPNALTPEQRKIAICRISALVDCLKKVGAI